MKAFDTALITGASLGIGLELTRQAAKDHRRLILVARSAASLGELKRALESDARYDGVKVDVVAMDLARLDAPQELFAAVTALGAEVETLVNNAGYGLYGRFLELDAKDDAKMLLLNMIALTEITRLFARGMAARRRGRILNVASTAAFQPGPLMATYFATKAYVLSFSEALGSELRDANVTVTALCPGPTRSGFQERAQMAGSRILKLGMMDAEAVAAQGWKGLTRGKPVVITGAANRLLVNALRLMPRAWVTRVSRFVSERKTA